jgi:hypothetical protein
MEREKRALAELRSLRRKNSRSPRPLPGLAANRPPSLSGDPLSTTNCTLDRIRNLTRRHQAKFSDGIPFSAQNLSEDATLRVWRRNGRSYLEPRASFCAT